MMTTDDEFTSRLVGFGLSEKDARTYLHLLKYGPKTPSPHAKSLKTYSEEIHRTLTALMEKGMVYSSLDTPTIYSAVDLDVAVESAVKKQESELREMEARKRELQELAKQQRFRPSDEIATFKVLKKGQRDLQFRCALDIVNESGNAMGGSPSRGSRALHSSVSTMSSKGWCSAEAASGA